MPALARVIVVAVRAPYRLPLAPCVAVLCACGARTGLFVPTDAGSDQVEDALPPIVVVPPKPMTIECADAGTTLVYVVTLNNVLMSFDPPRAAFARIGTISCPTRISTATPFSMAVDRTGIAYVVFSDGELFRVNTATAACQRTGFTSLGTFTPTFGMAYVTDNTGGGETLYVADTACPAQLGWIDTKTFALHLVGTVNRPVCFAELTGTGGGELYSFDSASLTSDAAISRIDKVAARMTARSVLSGVRQGTAWAFAFWGGDFYTFTAPSTNTVVTRFRPSDGSLAQVGQLADQVVGAGVSTCAPQL